MSDSIDPLALTRILVIDDDVTTHHEVEEALSDQPDVYVMHAEAPGDGIRLALDQRPDLILLDINMPGMDGFKVCRLLKESQATRQIPILFLTVDTNMRHLERAFDCGAADYLRKPVNEIELRARVRTTMKSTLEKSLILSASWTRSARSWSSSASAAGTSAGKISCALPG